MQAATRTARDASGVDPEALAEALRYRWTLNGRPEQREPPGDWRYWLYLAGRGAGKTRAGAEWIRGLVESGRARRIALVAPTAADVRDVVVLGPAGILAVFPPARKPEYKPSLRRVDFHNGAQAHLYSAEEPERLRGPQHDAAWCDELGAWRRPETWDMLLMGLRLGADPRAFISTTPKPTRVIKDLLAQAAEGAAVVTRGTTYDNRANIAQAFLDAIISRYEGTRLGRQELLAELLEDNPDALWQRGWIEATRVVRVPEDVTAKRIVVGVDPSITTTGDEAGIVTGMRGSDNRYYVLGDASRQGSPDAWAREAARAYHLHKADRIVYEANQGGELVAQTLHTVDRSLPLKAVHASRGKSARAEPVAALYEQGRVSHVGAFPELEDELCEWTRDTARSPNRLDALVWMLTELHTGGSLEIIDRRRIGL